MLGYTGVSQSTVSRYLRRFKANDPDTRRRRQSWMTFLKNCINGIAAMDFFVVPTITFKLLYVFFIVDHGRRKIIHVNVTRHPTAQWVKQQLREAFPFGQTPKYLIFDRDSIFSSDVRQFIKTLGITSKLTAYQSPWQNGVAERWVKSARTELLNHVIIFNERHLRRLMKEYVAYYNDDRCHLTLGRDSPNHRKVRHRSTATDKVVALPRLNGLTHKYVWRNAA
jgi:putative transposase